MGALPRQDHRILLMNTTRLITVTAATLALLFGAEARTTSRDPVYVMILHPTNPVLSVSRSFVANAFLKKVTLWAHGDGIQPVDLSSSPQVRERFSEDVLNR